MNVIPHGLRRRASRTAAIAIGVWLPILSCPAHGASPSAITRAEIDHLLSRLGDSGCRFHRNGSWHDATDARAHLGKKYQYLLDKGLVATSEDFIAKAGTKSSMSDDQYEVKCGADAPVPSAVWLTGELERFRAARKAEAEPK